MKIAKTCCCALAAALCAAAASSAQAGLVAKWDFNNYDPANPTSPNVLQATVGGAGKPCYYASNKGKGTALVTDGTLGQMYVVSPDYSGPDSKVAAAAAGLGAGNYAIAIPKYSHIQLPIPAEVKNHNFTCKIRFYSPTNNVYRCFWNNPGNTGDGQLFIRSTDNLLGRNSFFGGYSQTVSAYAWHTVTFSAGPSRWDLYLDETNQGKAGNNGNALSYFNQDHILLCADESGEDELLYIDYVEFYDEAGVYEAKLPHYSKAGLTGEWTFPAGNVTKATVGNDLEKLTRTGSADFTEGTDGVIPGDGHVNVGMNNGFKCYHNLTNNSSYTVVMDLLIPDNANKVNNYHGLLQGKDNADGPWWIQCTSANVISFRYKGGSTAATTVKPDEWMRVVLTYDRPSNTTVGFVNGAKKLSKSAQGSQIPVKGGFFVLLGDNSGEDKDVDISYAAFYDRVLTDAEIAELHARPLAQRADESFVPTVAPAGVWTTDGMGGFATSAGMPLAAKDSGWEWVRAAGPAAATYVFDITLPAVQTDGGVLVKNAANVASGVIGTSSAYSGSFVTTTTPATTFVASSFPSTWGYWSLNALDRTSAHRVAVTWAANGRVHYYVDGRPWGQIFPANGNTALVPTSTMTFLDGIGADVTRLAAYDSALTPDEIAALGGAGTTFSGNAPNAPTVSAALPADPVKARVDEVTFTVSATHPDGEYVSFAIDFGDGTGECSTQLVPPGTSVTFTHKYNEVGTMTPRVKSFSQNGVESAWTSLATPFEVVSVAVAARDVLVTWPWQQNVYTNRFTIMCEGVKDAEDATRWDGLEVQYGAGYAQKVTMTRVEGNGGTWIYTGHVEIDGADGQTIPYRLGYYGQALTFDDPADNTEGTVSLWSQSDDESFTCAVWGDNQQGLRASYHVWDSDIFLYVTRIFQHAVSRDVDFGISTGDMASNGNYDTEIRPCILDTTDAIFGRTRPYYVAWGNHDTGHAVNKPYFETGAVDEPAYGTSASGNYYLYRGNVLFIFIDHGQMTAAATQTWLADLLATERAQAAKFRILVQHYPFWLECWGGNNNQALLETAKAGGIDLVLSGHMHGYERIHKDGIVQLTNGGMGYLDEEQNVNANYGDATFVGGHKDIPYLSARQKSVTETDVLGPAEPVRMGIVQSYGELKVEGATLTYTAHGFNADGSYIGVFDEFSITSKTVAASAPAPSQGATCADPSTFAQFTETPVTNAKWKEYKDAVGEAFTFAEGAGDDPVVNVSKNEIAKFLAWLGAGYRLPTVGELETAFAGNMRRAVAEWTSSVDPNTGWCRILGSPALAAKGTWERAADRPCIATAGCHANYLGFRLATGAAPAEPDAPDAPLAPAFAALADIADPAAVYKWEGGTLVDITAEWTNPSGDLVYDVPVIFTGDGVVSNNPTAFNVTFNAGLAAPNCTQLMKSGEGSLTIKGAVKGGVCESEGGWIVSSEGALAFEDVMFAGQGTQFRSGDRVLLLKGENDFTGADIFLNGADNNCTNYVAATTAAATLRARRITNKGATHMGIGEGVSVALAKDYQVNGNYILNVDGTLDAESFSLLGNNDPVARGAGTLRIGFQAQKQNSWLRLGVSNLVFTTERPFRSNSQSTKSYYGIFLAGDTINLSSTCDWYVPQRDMYNMPIYFVADTRNGTYCTRPTVTFDGPYNVVYAPTASSATMSGDVFTDPWDIVMAGTGTLTMKTPTKGDIAVTNGTVKISALPCEGTTSTSGDGKWAIDETLSLSVGQKICGAFATGGTLSYNFGANTIGEYNVLEGSGLSDGDITVTTSLDDSAEYSVYRDWSNGNLVLRVMPAGTRIAEWTGDGTAGNPLDAANWRVTDTAGNEIPNVAPNSSTYVRLSGTTAMSFPATEGFEYAGLMLAEDIALAADCDWTGLGTVAFRDGAYVDLLGHKLDVNDFSAITSGKSGFTDSTTDAEHPGELHIIVAEYDTFRNDKVSLSGNMKVVKEGLGTYVAAFAPQTYTGGTLIAAGVAQPPDGSGANTTYSGDAFKAFGPGVLDIIEVSQGAVFDLRANYAYRSFVRLDGGTLRNSNADMSKTTWGGSGIGSLTKDSVLEVTRNTVFGDLNGYGDMNLGGYTLNVTIASGKHWYIRCISCTGGGKVVVGATGWLHPVVDVDASTVDFVVNSAIQLDGQLDVHDYEPQWSGAGYNKGSKALNVHGTFKPAAHDYFYGCTLMDGATIDLSNRTGALPLTSAFTDTGKKTLEFASGVTVNVLASAKNATKTANGKQIISWSAIPEGVTFQPVKKGQRLVPKADGLYLEGAGFSLIVR